MSYTKQQIEGFITGAISKGFAIVDDNFEDGVNSTLTLTGGWVVGSDGIAISTGGGWGTYATYDKYTNIDRVSSRALIQVIDAASVFAIIRVPKVESRFGTVAKIDCGASTISFMGSWPDGTYTTPVKSVSIPFSITANGKYLVELIKDRAKSTVIFTDAINQNNTVSLTYDNETETTDAVGRGWNAPGVMFFSGSIKVKRFTFASLFPKSPKLLITGHSFIEGDGLKLIAAVNSSYSNLLYDALSGDVAIAGRGGETSASILTREDVKYFRPKYHLVDIGTNDSDYATWLANIQAYITLIQSYGAIPILATIVPRPSIQTFANSCNSWIRTSGYNYIDFAKAISVGNDGVTMDSSLYCADGTHPNVAGNLKMFNQIRIDAPYIFDGVASSNDFLGVTTLTDAATITWDYNTQFTEAKVTLAGNRTLSITNLPVAKVGYLTLLVTQDSTGSRTLTLPAGTKVINGGAGAVALSTTANATDILSFRWNGTTLYCTYGKNYN